MNATGQYFAVALDLRLHKFPENSENQKNTSKDPLILHFFFLVWLWSFSFTTTVHYTYRLLWFQTLLDNTWSDPDEAAWALPHANTLWTTPSVEKKTPFLETDQYLIFHFIAWHWVSWPRVEEIKTKSLPASLPLIYNCKLPQQ